MKHEAIACKKVLFRNTKNNFELSAGILCIEKNKIKKIIKCNDKNFQTNIRHAKKEWPKLKEIANCIITPTFINAHTHIAMNIFRNFDALKKRKKNMMEDLFYGIEKLLHASDVRAFARIGAYESILNGTGCIWDHYYFGDEIAHALKDVGLCGVVAPTLQDLHGPGVDKLATHWDSTFAIHENKEYRENGIFAAFGPHATDTVSNSLWEKVLQAADKLGLPIHAHLAQSKEEFEQSIEKYKKSPIARLHSLGILDRQINNIWAHGIFIKKEELKLLKNLSNTLCFCPYAASFYYFPAAAISFEEQKVNWVLGTDCPASNDSMDLQKELRFLASIPSQTITHGQPYLKWHESKIKSTEDVNKARVKTLAKLDCYQDPQWLLHKAFSQAGNLHPQLKLGEIKEGYRANLALWDLNSPCFWPGGDLKSLCFAQTSNGIFNMMINGKWLGEDGNFQNSILRSKEYREAVNEGNERFAKLLKRI